MAQERLRPLHRQTYDGEELGLVIGIDVGTTFSGVSYAILRPGEVPVILPVTRFSGLETTVTKIPSIIYYDTFLNIKAIGAGTTPPNVASDAERFDWFKCEHFKLHMYYDKFHTNVRKVVQRPRSVYAEPAIGDARQYPDRKKLDTNGFDLGKLPPSKTAVGVMADFLKYLVEQTAEYIKTAHVDGTKVWKEVKDKVVFVLGHPNNWQGKPQERYRRAAVEAGLVPDTVNGEKRIQFVTEGEASALTCLAGSLGPAQLGANFRFILVDAGGGTIDISSYRVRGVSPVTLEECATSESKFAGSVFVNKHGFELLQRMLKGSEFDNEDTLRDIINDSFEPRTKREFMGDEECALVQIGNRRLNKPRLGITSGYLSLKTEDMAECFSFSIRETLESVKRHLAATDRRPAEVAVWLVGGFAASTHFLKRLSEELELAKAGVTVQRPQTNTAKAVADGTVLYYLDQAVKARRATTTYGVKCYIPYVPRDNSVARRNSHFKWVGDTCYRSSFDCILERGTLIDTLQPFIRRYQQRFQSVEEAKNYKVNLIVYDGNLPCPRWYSEDKGNFRTLCTLHVDLSDLYRSSTVEPGRRSSRHRMLTLLLFDVEIKLGTTELEAVVRYSVRGEDRCGSIAILYN